MTSKLVPLVHWSVRQKLNHVSSIEFRYVALYAPLRRLSLRFLSMTKERKTVRRNMINKHYPLSTCY